VRLLDDRGEDLVGIGIMIALDPKDQDEQISCIQLLPQNVTPMRRRVKGWYPRTGAANGRVSIAFGSIHDAPPLASA
jgi:hypothetical protein